MRSKINLIRITTVFNLYILKLWCAATVFSVLFKILFALFEMVVSAVSLIGYVLLSSHMGFLGILPIIDFYPLWWEEFFVGDKVAFRAILGIYVVSILYLIFITLYHVVIKGVIFNIRFENTSLFQSKLDLEKFLVNYGVDAARNFFFYFFKDKILPRLAARQMGIDDSIVLLMRYFRENTAVRLLGEYYYVTIYLIFVDLPILIVSTMFVINFIYYGDITLCFKWFLLLALPLIFTTTLAMLKFFHDRHVELFYELVHVVIISPTYPAFGPKQYKYTFWDRENNNIMSIAAFLKWQHIEIKEFHTTYTNFQLIKTNYFWINVYAINCFLIGWIYMLYYEPYSVKLIEFILPYC